MTNKNDQPEDGDVQRPSSDEKRTLPDHDDARPPQTQGEAAGGGTVEMDEPVDPNNQTVDNDLPVRSVDPSQQTVEGDEPVAPVDSSQQTVEADEPVAPVDPSQQTVEMDEPVAPVDPSQQTVEMDEPVAPVDPSQKTIEMDSGAGELTIQMSPEDARRAIEEARRSKPSQKKPPQSNKTIDMTASDGTIEVDSIDEVSDRQGKTVAGADKTIATQDGASMDPDRTRPDRDATMDSAIFSSGSANRVMVLWSSVNRSVRPGATIQAGDGDESDATTNLVIQSRDLRDSDELGHGAGADYELEKQLGEGGMGVVYLARQASIDRSVAIKMLKSQGAKDSKQRGKFLAEAVVTGELDHPNIVPIYDLGVDHSGALFYSMKRVVGTPWDDVLKRKSQAENLEILMKVADAVAFAHARGVIHRDLKPENVMLGDFGEVLVMDWGLAVPIQRSSQCSMGGTPAYMAPEMAAGPFEDVGVCSDIYLLGAILFEILVGKPPHTGKDVMKCLFAAAKNEIREHDQPGELMDVAMKAMEALPSHRYRTVAEFQAAIRDYQSHSESVLMTHRADELHDVAVRNADYDSFNRAIFGYEEAIERWKGNVRAREGLGACRLAFAELALSRGDFDLGSSMLDSGDAEHQVVLAKIDEGRRERVQKERRLKLARRLVTGLVVAIFLIIGVSSVVIYDRYAEAVKQTKIAESERDNAREARDNEASARRIAETAQLDAERAQAEEETARLAAEKAQLTAERAQEEERVAKVAAEEAKEEERVAKVAAEEAREKAEYEEYIAKIGLAAAKINDNAYDIALELLLGCNPKMRDWEWGRLMHLCDQASESVDTGSPVESVAIAEDGLTIVTGGWDGVAAIWERDGKLRKRLKHASPYVHAVAISPNGKVVATGSADRGEFIKLWNAETGELVRSLKGHSREVVSVEFSHDGNKLLSASYDKTARVWDVQSGELEQTLKGHNWWVWDASFSPDSQRVVTVSQDGTALVWDLATGEKSPPFDGHAGPIYCAAFSPDGKWVATGGYDKRVLVWSPEDLRPFDYESALAGREPAPTKHSALAGHTAAVRSVQFSRDGQRLVSGSHDNAVRIWGVQSRKSLKTLRGHGSWVRACAFSADGQWAVSGGYDRTAKLWNIDGYQEERVLRGQVLDGHLDALLGASFSRDGQFVLTASRDRKAKKWKTSDGSEAITFREGHEYLASTAIFFDKDTKVVTAAVDNTARIWDVAGGTEMARLHDTGIRATAAVSPDGQWIVTGSRTGEVKVWNVQKALLSNGKQAAEGARLQPDLVLAGHKREVSAAAYSEDGSRLITGDISGVCHVWDMRDGKLLGSLRGHTRGITSVAFAGKATGISSSLDKTVAQWDLDTMQEIDSGNMIHPASVVAMAPIGPNQVATACDDGVIRFWALGDATQLARLPIKRVVNSLAFHNNMLLTVDSQAAVVQVWDIENIKAPREVMTPDPKGRLTHFLDMKKRGGVVWSAAFSSDGDSVLTVGGDSARIWDLHTGRERISFSPHGAVASAKFSPDGEQVVTASWDNSARIWNAATAAPILKLGRETAGGDAHSANVNSACFSPIVEHRSVLTASDDGTAKLWGLDEGKVLVTFAGHGGRVLAADFSADGSRIVTACADRKARVFDAKSGKLLATLDGHTWGVNRAVFSKNGRFVVTGSEDNTAKVWLLDDLDNPTVTAELKGHTAAITAVDVSPNGDRVLTGCEDFTAKLWDAETGKELLTLTGHTQEVTAVEFSADGRNALTSGRDGVAIIWNAVSWEAKAGAE